MLNIVKGHTQRDLILANDKKTFTQILALLLLFILLLLLILLLIHVHDSNTMNFTKPLEICSRDIDMS